MNPINFIRSLRARLFYGWFVVIISFLTMTASYSCYYSWPVFYVAILDEFGWSRAETALIFSIAGIVYGLASPVSGILFDKFGPRKLFSISAIFVAAGAVGCSRAYEAWQFYISYGFLIGFGVTLSGYIPNAALVSAWFERRRSTALGIAQLGTRDTFLLAPVIQLVILAIGWRNSYLVLAAAAVIIIIPLAQFLQARPHDMELLPDGDAPTKDSKGMVQSNKVDRIANKEWASTEWTFIRAIKQYQYWSLFFMMCGTGFVFTALISHFIAFTTDIGFSALFAANLLFLYALSMIIARVCGFISDILGREISFTISISLALCALVLLLFTKDTSTPTMLYIATVCLGLSSGLFGPVYTASAADLFHGKKFGSIIGSLNVGYGLSVSIGTWLFGYIFDVTGTYTLAIIITMFAAGMMIIAMWVAAPRKVRRIRRTSHNGTPSALIK